MHGQRDHAATAAAALAPQHTRRTPAAGQTMADPGSKPERTPNPLPGNDFQPTPLAAVYAGPLSAPPRICCRRCSAVLAVASSLSLGSPLSPPFAARRGCQSPSRIFSALQVPYGSLTPLPLREHSQSEAPRGPAGHWFVSPGRRRLRQPGAACVSATKHAAWATI
jgi:hypothetical protein